MHKNLPLRSAKRHMRRDRQADGRWQRMHQASASRRDANERRTTNRQQAEEVTRQHNHDRGRRAELCRAQPSAEDAVDAARRDAIHRAPWDLVRRARRILAEGVWRSSRAVRLNAPTIESATTSENGMMRGARAVELSAVSSTARSAAWRRPARACGACAHERVRVGCS